jgi:phage terminase small subunit
MATATPTKKKPGPKPHDRTPAAKVAKAPVKANLAAKKAADQEKRFAKLRAQAVNATTARTQAIKSPERTLTEKQQMFVRHWAAGESILTASARAGYADGGTYAYRLSKDPLVLRIYEREKKLYEDSCQMTRAKVMQGFLDAAEMARIQADPTAMTGAWREVGKMCGYYEPKKIEVNVTGGVTLTTKVERMSDADLLRLIKGEASAQELADIIDVGDMREVLDDQAPLGDALLLENEPE